MDSTPNNIISFLNTHPDINLKSISKLKYSQPNIADRNYGKRITYEVKGKCIINQIIPSHITHNPSSSEWGYINTKLLPDNILTEKEKKNINKSGTLRIHSIKFNRLIELISIIVNIINKT